MDLAMSLRDALEREASGTAIKQLSDAVTRLSTRYRAVAAADEPILARPVDVLAYAHYRMPATFGAVRSALRALADSGVFDADSVTSMVDLGGGTGAAAWAAADVFETLRDISVLDQVPAALDLGQRLARASGVPALERTVWQEGRVGSWNVTVGAPSGGGADLATVSYVLSELSAQQADRIVAEATSAATRAVVIVEPGTPDGYARILRARDQLLEQSWSVAAPCPHQGACPLLAKTEPDWCHFAARVNRSSVHRQIKGGELSHEDEKFSYVAMVREPAHVAQGVPLRDGVDLTQRPSERDARIIRHPKKNKGFVELQVCEALDASGLAGQVRRAVVTKKAGPAYKQARDAGWGDAIDLGARG
ncbi:small ribosomal subunit Rsm22 family protein [Dermacoccus nishinomiyaensis]|uniref:small ribosomal subunit Rsm22 family protein n=2 Tax=Dermacoccus nishinomiyaensis TaxID=1274 RepID=UPI001EF46195|nr:small ribosomal subunit Rsm22 family protein [Dermacoccus nishinomiyaensis]MCG7428656.1 small ribosomal subunit Rsm22 family protein [Dermacoccus nishinomiyaensis]